MTASTKFGLATLVAIVLCLTPIGYCANSALSQASAAHPCCPAKPVPLPDDCARPGCIYKDTSVVPVADKSIDDSGPLCGIAISRIDEVALSATATTLATPLAPLQPYQRFVVFHQFLI